MTDEAARPGLVSLLRLPPQRWRYGAGQLLRLQAVGQLQPSRTHLGPGLAAQTRWWQARSSRQEVALCHDDYDCGAALTTGVSSLTVGSGTW